MSSTIDIEKNAFSQSYDSVPNSKSASIRSQPCPSSTKEQDISQKNSKATVVNGNPASENGGNELENDNDNWIVTSWIGLWWQSFASFLSWWSLGAALLVIPLALSATRFRAVHIKDVRLFGFFFWLAISWCGLLVSYITSWTLGYIWFDICQYNWRYWPVSDDYETFVVDIRHSMMLFLWTIISWALVPLLCVLDHHHCTDHWVSIFHKALLATFIFALVFLVKSFFVEWLFIKTAMETMGPRQRDLEKSFYAIVVLLPIFDQGHSMLKWTKAMRTWSRPPQITAENNLDRGNSDFELIIPSPPPTPSPPSTARTAEYAQYVTDIFQGNGRKDAYIALCYAIEELHRDKITRMPRHGLHRAEVSAYLLSKWLERSRQWYIWNKDFSLALLHFKEIEDLWPILHDSKLDNRDPEFVSFKDLSWLIEYLGESLKEAVQGQKNIKSVVNSLDVRLSIFLCIPVAIIYAAIFTKNFATNFAPLWTAFFGVSFAIQDPVKEFVSACVFVFAQHAYDKNDLVGLDEDKDVKLVVTQINLMHTSFEPVEGGKDIHIPHSKLSSDCIQNWSRLSQKLKRGDPISVVLRLDPKMRLPSDTDMKVFQARVDEYVRDHNPSHFYESLQLALVPIKDEDLFESGLQVEFTVKRKNPRYFYKGNKKFRNELLQFVRSLLRDSGFNGLLPKEGKSPIMNISL